jgi:hypothetical protein
MGQPTVRLFHNSWANRRRPTPEILPEFMDQPTSARTGDTCPMPTIYRILEEKEKSCQGIKEFISD